ncbi:MAG TPA: IclR family transcriptional regulator [Casimicrobiaceae bacterium]|nr:IclR family transcriptional regulator [Casimicrobiaceae bacterium]
MSTIMTEQVTSTLEPQLATHSATVAAEAGAFGRIKSLAKGLRALDLLLQRPDIGTVEVATVLGVDKGAASRLMHTLVEAGYAVQGAGRRYQAGPKLRARSGQPVLPGGASIRERARPLLQYLHDATLETSTLAVRADDQVLYLDKVATDLPLRVDRPVGTLSPLHCTALGKIFLAYGEAPLPRSLTSYTSRTPVDPEALRVSLAQIVQRGYAVDDEEFALGIRCVAAPLRDRLGQVVGAIGISGPTARISSAQVNDYGRLTKEVAAEFA